ncbi:hypothetical protein FHW67_000938 [Herbaspirillum sp. Sphag1AN]|uniref:hypothetical protein n=1 Tax=unclassified Herbaspirillum TaxID=2624150 RepID=UPI00161AFF55|nr:MULTISPECIES: hypothetical protein [unclassified Herbaspirillum]MBB3211690.1 hypothetical protein [Herbaspirillum sp. Sphag1AN]MBB3245042.1 hypothetical protein [Herbaspirillum sp. Sphag64]
MDAILLNGLCFVHCVICSRIHINNCANQAQEQNNNDTLETSMHLAANQPGETGARGYCIQEMAWAEALLPVSGSGLPDC